MEIRTVVQTAPVPSASTVQKPPQPDQPAQGTRPTQAPRTAPRIETAAASAPPIPKIRAELHYDENINRVVGRIVDEATGKEISELPPEELRALYAKTRAMLGPLVDEKV